MHKTTLEQWALLEKEWIENWVASRRRRRKRPPQSVVGVSYNLALLQERLGVTLLTPSGPSRGADPGR